MHLVGFIIRIYHDAQSPERVLESLADTVMQQSTHIQEEHVSVRMQFYDKTFKNVCNNTFTVSRMSDSHTT